jgi:two-component system cell cycle sensor histidine kinase/response regulator CckA
MSRSDGAENGEARSPKRGREQREAPFDPDRMHRLLRQIEGRVVLNAELAQTNAALAAHLSRPNDRLLKGAPSSQDSIRSVAHDFNNLLGVINAYCEVLTQSALSAAQQKSLTEIQEAVNRAGRLTQQLMAPEKSQPSFSVKMDWDEVTRAMVKRLEGAVPAGISVVSKLDAVGCTVDMSRDALDRVFLNLVTNAKEAMADGGTVTIETRNEILGHDIALQHDRTRTYAVLIVTDTGVGIDDEALERIFEPRFTTKATGHGLGLATVQRIVHENGGHVRISSRPGEGTTVRVYVPSSKIDG